MRAIKTLSHSETFPDSPWEQSHSKKITYTYDSMNRRVARTDENGTTQYLYGNPNHPFQLTAVRSPSGSLSRYHYDDFGLLFALERDNNWYYITTDQLGTPRVVCDANGELVKVLEYDSFGQVMADCHPEFELHISFAGGVIDVDTELVRFGFRDYDAVAGKWTAKDPIGFAGGDGNLYGYVNNSAVNLKDPTGQFAQVIPIIGIYLGVTAFISMWSNAIRNQNIHFDFRMGGIGRCSGTPNNKPGGNGSPKPPNNNLTPEQKAAITAGYQSAKQLGDKLSQEEGFKMQFALWWTQVGSKIFYPSREELYEKLMKWINLKK